MCPDPQLLSIYLDGEMPSPWKEKMQTHFEQCSVCKAKLDEFKQLQGLLKKDISINASDLNEQDIIKAKERVWNKIENRQSFRPRSGMWQRRLSIPLPAAAAAAGIILVLAMFWIARPKADQSAVAAENTNLFLAAEMDVIGEIPGIIPAAADMSGVLQYMTPGGTNVIILQLPESTNFLRSGEPEIIRAADFQRSETQRNSQRGRDQRGGSQRIRPIEDSGGQQ